MLVFLLIVVVAGVVTTAGGEKKGGGDANAETTDPKLVEIITVTPGKGERRSELSGVLQAAEPASRYSCSG